MNGILPVFSSHYSLNGKSLLTFEEASKSEAEGPVSIVDIAVDNGLSEVIIVDSRIDGFIEAYKNFTKKGIKLIYGVKLCVCADVNDKSENSLFSEHKIIIFIKNTTGYNDLIRIYNRAWTDGFYHQGRIDYRSLASLWNESNLSLALPFFSSFLAKNTLTFNKIIPSFPTRNITLFKEIDSELPFEFLLSAAIENYASAEGFEVQEVKSIYYKNREDFETLNVMKCIAKRTKFEKPNIDHLSSSAFCWEAYKNMGVIV